MANVVEIGCAPWTTEEMAQTLNEFTSVYAARPIQDNSGGMKSPHMFLLWFVLRKLKPKIIIESGLWFGQGTWLIEQACPHAQLHCIDINLSRLRYRSKSATYYENDFSTIDWSAISNEETLLLFDDHQNAYQRMLQAKWLGFKHILFEDNYPALQGDCYSLKKVFMQAGFDPKKIAPASLREKIMAIGRALIRDRKYESMQVKPNSADAYFLRRNLSIYVELPPVFKLLKTRWGDAWLDPEYPTPEPILKSVPVADPAMQIFLDEAADYNWMCYACIK